jgi:putative heme-binding domain-containing protein
VASLARDADVEVRAAAHRVLVAGAIRDHRFVTLCWEIVGDKTLDLGSRIDSIASLVQIESRCSLAWLDLLCSESPRLALAALRSLQKYAGQDELVELLNLAHAKIMVQGESLARELKFVQHTISTSASPADTSVSNEENRAALREWLLSHASEGDPLLGRLAFRRGACSRCHLASDNSTLLGPRLNGVAKTNGLEYIVDSVLYPSRVIKTGFMVELVVTDEGKSIVGKVSEHGDQLTITTADGEQHQIAQEYVEERQQINQSLMPEALESSMSEAELLDLIAYLLEQ